MEDSVSVSPDTVSVLANKKIGKYKLDNIYNGDSLVLMKDIPDSSIDLIVTDPPPLR